MEFFKQTFSEFSRDRCTTLAASLAYYTAFALPPLLYLLMTILTFGLSVAYDSQQAEERAEKLLETQAVRMMGTPSASEEIGEILDSQQQEEGKWWKVLLSFAGIVVGATGVVAALQSALNQVWEVKPDPVTSGLVDTLWKRVVSLAMILGLGFLLLVSLVVSSILSALGNRLGSMIGMSHFSAEAVNFTVQAMVVFVIFASIFKFMPDARVAWRDVLVGAAMTMALFLVGRFVMQMYFSFSNPGAQLGSTAAALAVLLVWVYYTAIIVLLGAEATQVYAVRYGRGIRPESHAVRVVEEIERNPAKA